MYIAEKQSRNLISAFCSDEGNWKSQLFSVLSLPHSTQEETQQHATDIIIVNDNSFFSRSHH